MRPYILITNDDGFQAKGIIALAKIMSEIGDVIVVAPDGPRSGTSNALTIHEPIRYKFLQKNENVTWYSCTGMPTDCVKLAFNTIVERKPDLIVSGINHGSNSAINVIYSGTMGAVLEGCAYGVPSIGFSLCDHSAEADFTEFELHIIKIVKEVLKNGLPDGICLNINAPMGKISGAKVVRQCKGNWIEEFEPRTDPSGRDYFWLTGVYKNREPNATDTDEWALENGYISIVPTKIDLTAHEFISTMQNWDL
ncbi:5'-nucleotidase SurE [uncultured Paludibacter sp.]|nr:5'-nucleotidase SurE [uncultured Paludibacter sp.]